MVGSICRSVPDHLHRCLPHTTGMAHSWTLQTHSGFASFILNICSSALLSYSGLARALLDGHACHTSPGRHPSWWTSNPPQEGVLLTANQADTPTVIRWLCVRAQNPGGPSTGCLDWTRLVGQTPTILPAPNQGWPQSSFRIWGLRRSQTLLRSTHAETFPGWLRGRGPPCYPTGLPPKSTHCCRGVSAMTATIKNLKVLRKHLAHQWGRGFHKGKPVCETGGEPWSVLVGVRSALCLKFCTL